MDCDLTMFSTLYVEPASTGNVWVGVKFCVPVMVAIATPHTWHLYTSVSVFCFLSQVLLCEYIYIYIWQSTPCAWSASDAFAFHEYSQCLRMNVYVGGGGVFCLSHLFTPSALTVCYFACCEHSRCTFFGCFSYLEQSQYTCMWACTHVCVCVCFDYLP